MSTPEEYHPTDRVEPCDHEAVNALKLTAALVVGMLIGGSVIAAFDAAREQKTVQQENAS